MTIPISASVAEGDDPVEMSITAYATALSIDISVAIKMKGFFSPGPLMASEISAVAVEHGNRFRPAPDWRPMTKEEVGRYKRQEAAELAEGVAATLFQAQLHTAAELEARRQGAACHRRLRAVALTRAEGPSPRKCTVAYWTECCPLHPVGSYEVRLGKPVLVGLSVTCVPKVPIWKVLDFNGLRQACSCNPMIS